jgi:hypothetical protein
VSLDITPGALGQTVRRPAEFLRNRAARAARAGVPERAPTVVVRLPGMRPMRVATDRVRARPAVTPMLAAGLGYFGLAVGLAELLAPRVVARVAGLSDRHAPLLRLFGLRELVTGYGLLSAPSRPGWLWARAAGDLIDLATLNAGLSRENPRRTRAAAAIRAVLAVGALDLVAGGRLTGVVRNCRGEARR